MKVKVSMQNKQAQAGDNFKIIVDGVYKVTDGWTPSGGATGKTRDLGPIEIGASSFDSFEDLLKTLGQWGIPANADDWMAFEDGQIAANQVENGQGYPMDDTEQAAAEASGEAMYLVDYTVYFEISKGTYKPTPEEIAKTFGIKDYNSPE